MSKPISPIIARLHRLQGQLAGVETMMTKQAPTSKLLQQLEAVRGSIKSLEQELISQKTNEISDGELKRSIKYLLKNT